MGPHNYLDLSKMILESCNRMTEPDRKNLCHKTGYRTMNPLNYYGNPYWEQRDCRIAHFHLEGIGFFFFSNGYTFVFSGVAPLWTLEYLLNPLQNSHCSEKQYHNGYQMLKHPFHLQLHRMPHQHSFCLLDLISMLGQDQPPDATLLPC